MFFGGTVTKHLPFPLENYDLVQRRATHKKQLVTRWRTRAPGANTAQAVRGCAISPHPVSFRLPHFRDFTAQYTLLLTPSAA